MTKVIIRRLWQGETGTLGTLEIDGKPICCTVERPWLNNKPRVSCIPAGVYQCMPHNGRRFKGVWRLENVPGRSAILIHGGNTMLDVVGCIAVGKGFGFLKGLPAVLDSRNTLDALRGILPEKFTLEIRNEF